MVIPQEDVLDGHIEITDIEEVTVDDNGKLDGTGTNQLVRVGSDVNFEILKTLEITPPPRRLSRQKAMPKDYRDCCTERT